MYDALIANIANGAALSQSIYLLRGGNLVPCAIEMPAAWTAANITFDGSSDGANFFSVENVDGTEFTVTAEASRIIILDPTKLAGLAYLKVRSGPVGAPVNQGAARIVKVLTRSWGPR